MHYKDAKSILTAKNGASGMNIYRGCSHGCIYCDSRSHCYQMLHDFEDIEVKGNAPELLEQALRRKRSPCMIGTGAMSDPYIPLEKQLKLTRRCLELIHRYGFGTSVLTKSDLVLRDLDLYAAINEKTKAVVQVTLTTWDEDLCRVLEPNVSTTSRRIEVLNACRDAGIPTVVWLGPILPFINDTKENVENLLQAAFDAKVQGILCFGMGLTLRQGNREYFYQKLDEHFPGMKQRYMAAFGSNYGCNSPHHKALMSYFYTACRREGVLYRPDDIFAYISRFEDKNAGSQLSFF